MQILEYIWVDGTVPTSCIRSKIKVQQGFGQPPDWGFDGSSTGQAKTNKSDVILKPVKWIQHPIFKGDAQLVLCEVYDKENEPHWTNERAELVETAKFHANKGLLFGFEQEYTLLDPATTTPVGINQNTEKWKQGRYYCGVGAQNSYGRALVEEHLLACTSLVSGINAEVMPGQWEFQTNACEPVTACDDLIMARYILEKLGEKHGLHISYDPKPLQEWNGAGCHTNFSTAATRGESDRDSWEAIKNAVSALKENHKSFVDPEDGYYGYGIERRLIKGFETSSIDKFTCTFDDNREASVRIPLAVQKAKKGHIEDRRPCANIDPYIVARMIIETIC